MFSILNFSLQIFFFRTEIDQNEQLCFSSPEELKGPIHNICSKVSHVEIILILCMHLSCTSISLSMHPFISCYASILHACIHLCFMSICHYTSIHLFYASIHPYYLLISHIMCPFTHIISLYLFYLRRLPKTIEKLLNFLLLSLNSSVEFVK